MYKQEKSDNQQRYSENKFQFCCVIVNPPFEHRLTGISFCFETVFSHPSKIDFLAEAKALGYEIVLVFIHLQMDELNLARVAQRVNEGGHKVPVKKIISRIPRTLKHIQSSLPLADKVQLYDNSSSELPFQLVARLGNGTLIQAADPLPDWAREMLRVQ